MTDHPSSGYKTTFLGLFDEPQHGRPAIREIEIPIIQRDFAQGRKDDETSTIRDRFVDAIVDAITSDRDMGLDFIYGDVKEGVLRPLDGQQRLTTLFLLHWYVASLADELEPGLPWLRFSYATRPTARDFSTALAENPYPMDAESPTAWITDQPWYVYPWRQDPTISSMLVMLDAIHARLQPGSSDFGALWSRLSQRTTHDGDAPIWFIFLPVVDADLGEDLYIKMNSRGKPLTTFEVFKADFESIIKSVDPGRHKHLVDSMDRAWADTLWQYERRDGGDFKTDDEFERYLTFIIEICEWRDGAPERKWHDQATRRTWPIEKRAALAFADVGNPNAETNRDFFFHAFDTWVGKDPREEFEHLFTAGASGQGSIPLFSGKTDLFGACISKYGTEFSGQETLLLFGVLLARQAGDGVIGLEMVQQRLRSLRNVTAAFLDRDRYMPQYVASTAKLILDGNLHNLEGFRGDWVADEAFKWSRMEEHPGITAHLHQLEDNPLIRGRVMAFDLDETKLAARARAFAAVSHTTLRDLLGAALLTKGDYSRDVGWGGNKRQLGSSRKDDSWTDMLTTGSRMALNGIREPLMSLLDDVAVRMSTDQSVSPEDALEAIRSEWVAARADESRYDWRYYLTRYAGARSSKGDGYYNGSYDPNQGGFKYDRFRLLHGSNYNAYFSDALLRAAWVEGELDGVAEEPSWWHRDNPGMTLKTTRVEIHSVEDGFELLLPADNEEVVAQATDALTYFPGAQNGRVTVKQSHVGGAVVDCEDRVQMCIKLAKHLHEAGL